MEFVLNSLGHVVEMYLPVLKSLGVMILKTILILLIGWYLARFLSKKTKKVLVVKDEIIANFGMQVVFVSVMILSVVTALGSLGVQTGSILAVIGTAGLAIALALRDSLSSLASGIILIILRPFRKGDDIEVGNVSGKVESLNLFNTFIVLPDNKIAILPNRNITSANIINSTRGSLVQIEWMCSIKFHKDVDRIKSLILNELESLNGVEKSREIFVGLNSFNENSLEFCIRFWVRRRVGAMSVRCLAIENIKKALDNFMDSSE